MLGREAMKYALVMSRVLNSPGRPWVQVGRATTEPMVVARQIEALEGRMDYKLIEFDIPDDPIPDDVPF